ncbi:serine protease inhibitor dipetalogastin-like [Periplaneta americana]|uniref:serine protease inhibitor dipetalogastin-like n=1 Tax=Periplaneta americana TaxID=6978 RepID=UPI0037E7976C
MKDGHTEPPCGTRAQETGTEADQGRDLRILHDGPCQYRDVVISSDDNKVCNLADNNAIMMPVCGTDNVTYPNPFILRCAAYRGAISSDIEVEHEGACDDNLVGKETPDYEEDPCQQISNSAQKKPLFCASDGRSYYSAQEYACAVKANSDWFHYTIIKVGASCEKRDSPCEKLQVLPEALQADPICGSDGTSYINPLALMCAMTTEPKLKKHHKGPCI